MDARKQYTLDLIKKQKPALELKKKSVELTPRTNRPPTTGIYG